MPFRHLIRLLPDGSTQWLAADRTGRILEGPRAGFPVGLADEVIARAPSEAVTLLWAPRVGKNRRQLEQAVPFAIEENLAVPVEHCRVAIAPEQAAKDQPAKDQVIVAVIANARLEAMLERLTSAGHAPDRLVPESWLLPFSGSEATLLLDGSRAVLRHGDAGALAGDAANELPQWLAYLAPHWPAGKQLRCVGDATALSDPLLETCGYALHREVVDSPLAYLARRLDQTPMFDLLAAGQARRKSLQGGALWRIAAVLAGIACTLLLGSAALEVAQLKSRHATQRLEMETLLRQALPGTTRIVDAKAQLLGEVARRQGTGAGDAALALLASVAPVLSGSGRYTIDALDYRGGTLDLTLRTDAVATLDSLRESLASLPGVTAELVAVTPGGGGVEGKLRLKKAGA